ncbi:MAG: hypothetical protein QM809_05945 [Gordonia sp. (in: high G+C Gram-positive bacteria)]|uniref:hypothetical protein n=1 Tax=Gordonia sp. (in: high G+C Gram-positive bacteria) TaxID=84139 RepID=UPI0039E270B9
MAGFLFLLAVFTVVIVRWTVRRNQGTSSTAAGILAGEASRGSVPSTELSRPALAV